MAHKVSNPRAVVGANEEQTPDYITPVTQRLTEEYAELSKNVTEDLRAAREDMPPVVESDDELGKLGSMIKRLRDTAARCEAFFKREKEPYLRGGQAVDAFFKDFKDRLGKAADILDKRGDAYNQKKLAEAREKLRREAEEREALAKKEREEADRKAREAREAEEAAARARKPERKEELRAVAEQKREEATGAISQANVTAMQAADAQEQTQVKAADVVRTRHVDEGRLTTMQEVPYVEVTDRSKLPLDLLAPYFTDDHLLAAVKAYGKVTKHKKSIPGAVIEMRPKTVWK